MLKSAGLFGRSRALRVRETTRSENPEALTCCTVAPMRLPASNTPASTLAGSEAEPSAGSLVPNVETLA